MTTKRVLCAAFLIVASVSMISCDDHMSGGTARKTIRSLESRIVQLESEVDSLKHAVHELEIKIDNPEMKVLPLGE